LLLFDHRCVSCGEEGIGMQRRLFVRWPLMLVLLLSVAVVFAQPNSSPVVDKVDPPNWWPALPNPMLLLYGQNLNGAHFAVEGSSVSILKTLASSNGHYAFLWLTTKGASPQKLRITATNPAGSAKTDFELKTREPARGRYQGFNPSDVIYLIMTDRFADGDPSNDQPGYAPEAARGWHGGDFRGIEDHLDYLQQLGITTLWLTPILSNANMPESYHGYAAVDLYAVDSHFGTLAEYQHLVRDLHNRGMKMVFDSVPNHIGVQHPWVHDPPTPDWFHGTFEQHTHINSNFEELVDPHAAPADSLDITHGWFTDSMPDLNQENPLVATYLIQNATWWIETAGLDGLRIDTFPYVGRAFWSQYHKQLHSLYPNLTTVGEVFNGDPAITSFFAGGVSHAGIDTGLYTPFDFPTYFALRDVLLHDKPMTDLARVLAADHLYPHPERLVPFFANHDTRRFLSEPGATPDRLKLAFALLTTMRGTPEIYSGDEIGMEGGDDPDNRRDFRGGFTGGSHDAFKASGRTAEEQDVFSWASSLIYLRKSHDEFTSDQQDLMADATAIAYVRGKDLSTGCSASGSSERILVVASKDSRARKFHIPSAETAVANCTQFRPLFPPTAPSVQAGKDSFSFSLQPNGVAIYAVR
jgi:glycosidase